MNRMQTHWRAVGALAASLALIATACGDDGKTTAGVAVDAGDGSADAGSGDASAGTVAATDPPATGGGADDRPIRLGFHNLDGGTLAFPEIRAGLEAAVGHINAQGGVNGRPLEILNCNTDGSPESSLNCANRFVENDVDVAVSGVDIGADSMIPVLAEAGIPSTGYGQFGTGQRTDIGRSFYFASAQPAFALSAMKYFRDQGAERMVTFHVDIPDSYDFITESIRPPAEQLGLELTPVIYDGSAPDWAALVATALRSDPDVVGAPGFPEADCIGMVSALRAVGYGGLIWAAGCSEFIAILGEDAAGAIVSSDAYLPLVRDELTGDDAAEMALFFAAMDAAGSGHLANNAIAQTGFATAMDLYTVLLQVDGEVNATSIHETLRTAKGKRFLSTDFDCGNLPWPGLTNCSLGVVVYAVTPEGKLTVVSGGFADLSEFLPSE